MAKAEVIKIRNWAKFQHYKRRSPPWIRLYRDVIDTEEWRGLSDAAKALLAEVWLIASEGHPGGSLSADLHGIAWKTGRPFSATTAILAALQELHEASFLTLPASMVASTDASAFASMTGPQSQRTETEGETDTTRDQENGSPKGWSKDVVHVDLEELAIFCKDFGIPHEDMNRSLTQLGATELLP